MGSITRRSECMTTLRTFGFVPASTGKQRAAVAMRTENTRWKCALARFDGDLVRSDSFDGDLVRSDSSVSTDVISPSLIGGTGQASPRSTPRKSSCNDHDASQLRAMSRHFPRSLNHLVGTGE